MLSLKEAGSLLGVSYATVRRLIEKGWLPAINVTPYGQHKNYRIKKEDLQHFMTHNSSNNFLLEQEQYVTSVIA